MARVSKGAKRRAAQPALRYIPHRISGKRYPERSERQKTRRLPAGRH
jgi:hypothetical protein